MADRWVEEGLGSGNDDGTTPANAWRTHKQGFENANSAGDDIYHRRATTGTYAANISPTADGNLSAPIRHIGWPRNAKVGTGDWLNGSNVIMDVSFMAAVADRGKYMGRMVKNDTDAKWYFITAIAIKLGLTDASGVSIGDESTGGTSGVKAKVHYKSGNDVWVVSAATTGLPALFTDGEVIFGTTTTNTGAVDGLVIDREYAGATEGDGNTTIVKDRDYDARPQAGIDAGLDADADDLPVIDFAGNDNNFYAVNVLHNIFRSFDFKNGVDTNGLMWLRIGHYIFEGCLFVKTHNSMIIYTYDPVAEVLFRRCIIVGAGNSGDTLQDGMFVKSKIVLEDVAVYNCGNNGFAAAVANFVSLKNVNFGHELSNEDDSFNISTGFIFVGGDIIINDDNGGVLFSAIVYGETYTGVFSIENYNKIINTHRTFNGNGTHTKVTAGGGGNIPNQRGGGATTLIEIIANGGATRAPVDDWAYEVFTHELDLDADTHTLKYYVQNLAAINASDAREATDIWLEVEYIAEHDDASEFVFGRAVDGLGPLRSTSSNNPIPIRADADDWNEYLTITFTLAVASRVRITCKQSYYDATPDEIYVDPLGVLS